MIVEIPNNKLKQQKTKLIFLFSFTARVIKNVELNTKKVAHIIKSNIVYIFNFI